MSQFDDRKNAAEHKHSRDKELEFKATARRNKLLGVWAAGLMGMEGEAIDAYAMQVVESDFEEAGEEDVYRKISGDFETADVEQSENQIRKQMADLMGTALEQVRSEV
ncbi:MAG: DUF1476 domain-containing protein [Emcibacteraceae bacterium]|nr:DUF1476 domain-containing protein [Emcibacteraceae bacterium]